MVRLMLLLVYSYCLQIIALRPDCHGQKHETAPVDPPKVMFSRTLFSEFHKIFMSIEYNEEHDQKS